MIKHKKIEIFCGTGGVGKTTVSASRAIYLAGQRKKVLLITIDPAKRLKQVLGISEEDLGQITSINKENFGLDEDIILDALLLNPESTIKRILGAEINNEIIENLAKPHGGLNEIMAVLEVQYHFNTGKYDTIILDTPPGQHFVDFLDASRKIKTFFDKNFVDIFNFIDKRNNTKRILTKIITSGVDKLLSYLEKVTGENFVNEFIKAIHILYSNRNVFIDGLKLEHELINPILTNWFLVTSADQVKGHEAQSLINSSKEFMNKDSYVIVNKSWNSFINEWETISDQHQKLKNKLVVQQQQIKENVEQNNINLIEFPEIFENRPLDQVMELSLNWKKYDI